MDIANLIGWLGNAAFILGNLLFFRKHWCGWLCNLLGNVAYVIQGKLTGMESLWALSLWLCCMNLYGAYSWRFKKDKSDGEKQK